MLKIGDKVKWSPKALRFCRGDDRAILRKEILQVSRVHPNFDHKVKVDRISNDKTTLGWYKQNYFVKV